MTCDHFRELISARLDDELDPAEADALDAHLNGCAECAAFADRAEQQRRDFRLHAATELADLAEPRPNLAGSLAAVSVLRWALLAIGIALIVLKVGDLLTATTGADSHLSHHDGVFGTALGIGMVSVAIKPQRAIGLLPLTSTIAVLMSVAAVNDLAQGNASMLAEAVHVIEFAGLVCLWVISGGVSRLQRRLGTVFGATIRSTVPG